ncbi:MAG: hypothetical protein E6L09_06555 [Verrucomicrobia bacterium]|nr:MAG: hypothetical protein E6L09_06555 [Verrucomicrobiota bacterium]
MKQAITLVGSRTTLVVFAAVHLMAFDRAALGSDHTREIGPFGFLVHTNYHGWANSILVSNGRVEAIIVPAVGRVMQFRFAGDEDGPFWENRALAGRAPDPAAKEWGNFGGDKSWPAPQSDWPRITPRAWPPPVAFDSMPVEAGEDGFVVKLISAVDPHYGIRTYREITLALDQPVMSITTTYEKVSGQPIKVSVWVITQLKDPVMACASLPESERFREGYNRQSDELPSNLRIADGLLTLTRDPKTSHKVGTDAGALFWVGKEAVVRIDSPRKIFGEYPDEGCSAEIYTNPDPLAYVELEMLGPLQKLIAGDSITRTSTYTLLRRTEADPELEVRRILSH